jgi:ribulose-5-phosphate 4-epimerase/fuculose-1-phosphate aldolase
MNEMSPAKLHRWSDAEWALRVQLADCYHVIDYLGWTEMMIFNHISARVPGPETHYLVNPFGLTYSEVTPKNLLKVDLDGNLVEDSEFAPNPAGFALHSAIHGARPDAHCVIHTHTNAVSAIALKQSGFGHDDFYGAQLFNRIGYHAFEGITLFAEERPRMLASLGDKDVLVLRNHGVAVCGGNVAKAFMNLWTVQRAAEIQCQAGMLPGPNTVLTDTVRQRCADSAAMLVAKSGFAEKVFDATVRRMKQAAGTVLA